MVSIQLWRFKCVGSIIYHFGFIYKKGTCTISSMVTIQMWSFKCVASILYKLLQDSFIFYYFHCFHFHSNHFLVYHKKKWHALSPHLNAIYPAVKFEACIFNTFRVIAESIFFLIFTVHFDSNHFFGLSAKKSDVQYLLIGIYPAVKFQMCSYNSFRVSA